MKKYIISILILTVISCQFDDKKTEKEGVKYPFEYLEIESIKSADQELKSVQKKSTIKNIIDYLKGLSDQDFVKDKRLHGAEKICSVIIQSENDEITIIFKTDDKKKVTASFLIQDKNKNFINSLGRLENGKELLELMKKNGIPCDQKT